MTQMRLMTLEMWEALPDTEENRRVEVVEGIPVRMDSPQARHSLASWNLRLALRSVLPAELVAIQETAVVLNLDPFTVREPDLVVLVEPDLSQHRFTPERVRLVAEVLSPSTGRTDRVVKPREYAAAGIPEYWLVDLDAETLTSFELRDGAYVETGVHTGPSVLRACGVDVPLDVSTLGLP
jgi:Uma2 family endonuclease